MTPATAAAAGWMHIHPSRAMRFLCVGTLAVVADSVLAADRGAFVEICHRGRGIFDELHERVFKASDAGAGWFVSLRDDFFV